MALEERFVDADILDSNDPLTGFVFDDSVDEQEWIPVGQDGFDLGNIQQCLHCESTAPGLCAFRSLLLFCQSGIYHFKKMALVNPFLTTDCPRDRSRPGPSAFRSWPAGERSA